MDGVVGVVGVKSSRELLGVLGVLSNDEPTDLLDSSKLCLVLYSDKGESKISIAFVLERANVVGLVSGGGFSRTTAFSNTAALSNTMGASCNTYLSESGVLCFDTVDTVSDPRVAGLASAESTSPVEALP